MSKKTKEQWFERLRMRAMQRDPVPPGAGEIPPPAHAPVAIEVVDDDPYWMIAGCTPGRRTAYVESLGGRYGHPDPTAAYVLDRWGETAAGTQWMFNPGDPVPVVASSRARLILDRTFTRTQQTLERKAGVAHGGDMEAAMRHAIDEQMTLYGLDA